MRYHHGTSRVGISQWISKSRDTTRRSTECRDSFEKRFTPASSDQPNSQIPECTCSISHNAPFRTEMCTFLFWMERCGIWNRCILGFVKLVYCVLLYKIRSWFAMMVHGTPWPVLVVSVARRGPCFDFHMAYDTMNKFEFTWIYFTTFEDYMLYIFSYSENYNRHVSMMHHTHHDQLSVGNFTSDLLGIPLTFNFWFVFDN